MTRQVTGLLLAAVASQAGCAITEETASTAVPAEGCYALELGDWSESHDESYFAVPRRIRLTDIYEPDTAFPGRVHLPRSYVPPPLMGKSVDRLWFSRWRSEPEGGIAVFLGNGFSGYTLTFQGTGAERRGIALWETDVVGERGPSAELIARQIECEGDYVDKEDDR